MQKYLNIFFFFLLAVVLVLFYRTDPATKSILPPCIFHSLSGYHCPVCGSQRAVHELLHLNFRGVIENNLLFLPGLLLVLYQVSRKIPGRISDLKLPNLLTYRKSPWVIIAIILLFWLLRNLPFHPFTLLAPQ